MAALCAARWRAGVGLTELIQFDVHFAAQALPELKALPHYTRARAGYDGQFYAQLALDPALRDPGLKQALDAPELRARRIMLSAVGFVAGLGRPTWIIQIFPFLNLGAWLGLMALLLGRPEGRTTRGLLAAVAVLLSVGVLESVRLCLTDLPASLLLLLAAWRAESPAVSGSFAMLSLFSRETGFLALPALFWPRPVSRRALASRGLIAVAAALPWLLWAYYVHCRLGGGSTAPAEPHSIFAFPGTALIGRVFEELRVLQDHFSLQAFFAVAAAASLLVQLAYLAIHPLPGSALWRVGILYGGLFVCLGPKIWEIHMQVCRVALPMTIAFNLLLAEDRTRKFPGWFLAGNVFSLWGTIKFATTTM